MQKWEWVKLVNDSGLRNEVGIHHSLSIHCAALWLQNYGCDWACDLKCGKFTSINGRIGRVVRPPGPVGVLDPARNPKMAIHIKMDRESPKSPKWPKFCSWICQILHVQGLNPNQILAPQFCTMLCLQYWHPLLLHSGVVVWKRYPAQRVGGRFSRLRCWVAELLHSFLKGGGSGWILRGLDLFRGINLLQMESWRSCWIWALSFHAAGVLGIISSAWWGTETLGHFKKRYQESSRKLPAKATAKGIKL